MLSKLYIITDDKSPLSHYEQVKAICKAGGKLIQFRSKQELDKEKDLEELSKCIDCAKEHGATLIVNDHAELAKKLYASGVHLGASDMVPSKARTLLGGEAIIGLTINSEADIDLAQVKVADYFGMGPFSETKTKISNNKALHLEGMKKLLAKLRAVSDKPVFAIGGVTATDTKQLLEAGFFGVAVSSPIVQHEQVGKQVKSFTETI